LNNCDRLALQAARWIDRSRFI